MRHRILQRSFLFLLIALAAACAGDYPQTALDPVTEYGRIQDRLWAVVTWWTVAIMVVVFGALAFILVRFRGREGDPRPKQVYGSTRLELAWTVGPAIVIVFISVPTIQAIFATQSRAPEDALVIEAIGHQWWWEFRYPELGITTANQFHVPTGQPLDLQLRSADVIHSFWVPRLGGKKDVNPVVRTPEGIEPLHLNNIPITVDSVGRFLGQCAEFCGTSHAIMRMMAVAVPPAEFEQWVQAMRGDSARIVGTEAARGREVFLRSTCVACHRVAGTSAAGVLGPDLTLMGDRFSIGAGALANTPENLTEWILRAPELKKGIIMPGARTAGAAIGGQGQGFPATGLSEQDARAVAAYLSSLRLAPSPIGQ